MKQDQVKTFADLVSFCVIHGFDQTVLFTPDVENAKCDPHFGPFMKAKIHGLNLIDRGISITFDFKEFEDHNRRVSVPCFFDKNGSQTIIWQESIFYPKNHKETVWVEREHPIFFKFLEDSNKVNLEQLKANILRLEKIVAPREVGVNSISLADSPESLLICVREYVTETKKLLGVVE